MALLPDTTALEMGANTQFAAPAPSDGRVAGILDMGSLSSIEKTMLILVVLILIGVIIKLRHA